MSPETIAQQLETYSEFRVLRALKTMEGVSNIRPLMSGEQMGVTLDTETTGLDFQSDRIVELAIQRFIFDRSGRILEVERPRSWLEDPGHPLPERVSRMTGISDTELVGRHFDDDEIAALIGGADLVIAHNAAFDRPFVDHRFPKLRNLAWACSLSQIDWLKLGFDGRALGHLLFQAGWFFQGHRAINDVSAVTSLLHHDVEGQTVLAHLLQRCLANSARIEAIGAPFDAKDLLRSQGYRWDATKRFWWREVEESALPQQIEWLEAKVYRGSGRPTVRLISPRERFAVDQQN